MLTRLCVLVHKFFSFILKTEEILNFEEKNRVL